MSISCLSKIDSFKHNVHYSSLGLHPENIGTGFKLFSMDMKNFHQNSSIFWQLITLQRSAQGKSLHLQDIINTGEHKACIYGAFVWKSANFHYNIKY